MLCLISKIRALPIHAFTYEMNITVKVVTRAAAAAGFVAFIMLSCCHRHQPRGFPGALNIPAAWVLPGHFNGDWSSW
jgi:hypothetical protein